MSGCVGGNQMDELDLTRKDELIRALTAKELSLDIVQDELSTQTYSKLPLSRITAFGAGLEPVVAAMQQITSHGQAMSGYYKVTIPKGTHLAEFKDGSGFLGTALGNGIEGQARLNPLVCNPTLFLAAATLANIDKKLDAIRETQQEILDLLVQKEKSKLRGNLDFLMDVYNNYKYNWSKEKYKIANHIKVLDIRQEAGYQIDFQRERIKNR